MDDKDATRNDGGPALIGITGGLAAAAGLVLGLLPVSAVDGGTCGSPFSPASRGTGIDNALVLAWCGESLSVRQGWAWVLLIAGIAAVVTAIIWRMKRKPTDHGGETVSSELDKLASLHASGALNDDEFQAAKSRLLGQGPRQGGLSTE